MYFILFVSFSDAVYIRCSISSIFCNLSMEWQTVFVFLIAVISYFTGLLIYRYDWHQSSSANLKYYGVQCRLTKRKEFSSANPASLLREPHKYFDQVVITVHSGDGGHGAILTMANQRAAKTQGQHEKAKTKRKSSYKRDFDGSLILPMGGHGGDVIIYADESKDTLLEFHKKSRYNAKRGGNVDAMGVLTSQLHDGLAAPTLRIPVPVGSSKEHVLCKEVEVMEEIDDIQHFNFLLAQISFTVLKY